MPPHIDLEKTATLRVGRGMNASPNSNSKPNGLELELLALWIISAEVGIKDKEPLIP